MVRTGEAGGVMAGDLGQLRRVTAQSGDDAGEDQDQAVAARVDDARLAQHLELLRRPADCPLTVGDRDLEDLGQDGVLLVGGDSAVEPLLVGGEVGQLAGDRVGHLAKDRKHRSLGRVPDRFVGRVGGACEGGRNQNRIDQLSRPAGQLLGGSANDLARIRPSCPRAPISAALARACTSWVRPTSSTVIPSSRSSSSITARIVIAMLSPVSPSATGKTLRSLTS